MISLLLIIILLQRKISRCKKSYLLKLLIIQGFAILPAAGRHVLVVKFQYHNDII